MMHVDITELASNPIRTGIQRVVRELLQNWRAATPLAPCVYDGGRDALVYLPEEAVAILREETADLRNAPPTQLAEEIRRIRAASPMRKVDPPAGRLLVPELFYDAARCRFYLRRLKANATSTHFLIYDFIPWLEPTSIGVEDASSLMRYLTVTQAAQSTAFISDATRRDWADRILRQPSRTGPVVPLGADGLGLERQVWRQDRRTFVCIGSLDGRRNQHMVVRAFQSLWRQGFDMRLAIYGHAFDVTSPVASEVIAAAKVEPLLDHYSSATDQDVMNGLRAARATIYASTVEGYGLPPVESLHAGIPVIVTRVPSVVDLPRRGYVQIASPSPQDIEAAVRTLENDRTAETLWRDTSGLPLTTWRDFAEAVQTWVAA